jgi:hypothetical protein
MQRGVMGRTVMPGGKSGAPKEEATASSRTGRSALKNGMGRSRGLVRENASFKCISLGLVFCGKFLERALLGAAGMGRRGDTGGRGGVEAKREDRVGGGGRDESDARLFAGAGGGVNGREAPRSMPPPPPMQT